MPVEARPLFRPDILRRSMAGIALPPPEDEARARLAEWAELLNSPQAANLTEQALLPDFLTDVFYRLLGYTGPGTGGGRYTLSREKHVAVDGQYADAVLGDFHPGQERFLVAVEGKGPQDPLERPFGGRRMSAVDQGYRYAINLRCNWIVVTNLRQIRLVPDDVCRHFKHLGDYDYRSPAEVGEEGDDGRLVDVDILGHIFERSITELEQIHVELAAGEFEVPPETLSRRHHEGAFYTPAFVTRYIVGQALSGVLEERFERLRRAHHEEARGTARRALADQRVYDLSALPEPGRKALVAFWEAWLDDLQSLRLLDPACGSGAFLIEAFDQLHAVYQAATDRLEELRGQRSLFDPDRTILRHNLYGVDLNQEAIEICRLSIWIKTAQRGKPLTDLDHTVRVGNSLVEDEVLDERALDWRAAFPEVFDDGGFDVVVGNPPYVRQELLGPFKEYFSKRYASYHGMADLYVYFYERRLSLLKPGGRLSFIVTNKWMKAGYGEPLRRHFHGVAWMESVVDLGHAKQIFEDADVFPSIVVVRKPVSEAALPEAARVCAIPRDQLRIEDLGRQIDEERRQTT